ncbi:MAG: ADP-glyceromanno-heptose 6-epimerase [Prosthecobacter sp.]|jgi:ADP-L-glycero-D-manno-heptose 6-epimerase|uniref:ADP-glyceromanno-heptose 6-epimerase n=1 Tax=Prosthecobacter sp. TaxID=1965333 RepID=UPI001A046A57|nr:ADP-glyceromanno-heptose 6-epimerase [Prosthecobacter sp.]MBE2282883.1 ADP-glyceromanno-heptose 6-epimerase [Prosthecobacter sp.]
MKNTESRILITGGAGFIGSALVWELNRRGCENIVVCDRLSTDEKWKNLVPLRFADYIDGNDLLQAVQHSPAKLGRFDHVLHLGACSATTERDADYLMRNNYEFTKQLCQWSLANQTRFVYASSAATYGDGAHGMNDQDPDIHKLRPLNMYGYSKHLFDLHAKREGWLPKIVGLKYFNVYGPNEDHKADMRSLVHKACGQILATGKVQLFKSHRPDYKHGEQMRDFLYVKDAIRMTLHLAETHSAGGLFNLGSGKAHTWVELATAIFTALGKEPVIEFIDMPEHLQSKYQYYTCADIAKLRASGFTQEITALTEAVRDYVQGYLVPDKRLGDEPVA